MSDNWYLPLLFLLLGALAALAALAIQRLLKSRRRPAPPLDLRVDPLQPRLDETRPPRPEPREYEYWLTLTDREEQVARQVAQGRQVEEIAQALSLTRNTVRNHLSHIRLKFNIHSHSRLVAVLQDLVDYVDRDAPRSG